MRSINSSALVLLGRILGAAVPINLVFPDDKFNEDIYFQPKGTGRHLVDRLREMGLSATANALSDLVKCMESGEFETNSDFARAAGTVNSVLLYELENVIFLCIPPSKAWYYPDKQRQQGYENYLFAPAVLRTFPTAAYDIDQAGRCLATANNTACVFHLMRVMEVGLDALKSELKIRTWHSTWRAAIDQIRKKLRSGSVKKLKPAERRRNEFIQSAIGYIEAISVHVRNPTMHKVDAVYDEQGAIEVYNAVKGFMGAMAKELAKQGK